MKCIVVDCTSGYSSYHEKVAQFCVPKDTELRGKWARAIPRKDFTITEKHYVCVKHFKEEEEDIIRFWQSGEIKVSYYTKHYFKFLDQ